MDVLVVVVVLSLAAYVVSCLIWPFQKCRWCKGRGRHMSPMGTSWMPCVRCGGSGKRKRWTLLRKSD